MTFEETEFFINSLKEAHKISPQEPDAAIAVASTLRARGEPIDKTFICPTCGRKVNNWMGKEFLMEIGECHSCDHCRTDAMSL